jgi:hypothetical protein
MSLITDHALAGMNDEERAFYGRLKTMARPKNRWSRRRRALLVAAAWAVIGFTIGWLVR